MSNLNDYKNIWVFIETECGKPKNVGYELLNVARPLADQKGCPLIAVVIGKDIENVAKDAICYGADSAIIVDGPEYEHYTTDAFTKARDSDDRGHQQRPRHGSPGILPLKDRSDRRLHRDRYR